MDLFVLLRDAGLDRVHGSEKSRLGADFGIMENDDVFSVPNGYIVLPEQGEPFLIEE